MRDLRHGSWAPSLDAGLATMLIATIETKMVDTLTDAVSITDLVTTQPAATCQAASNHGRPRSEGD